MQHAHYLGHVMIQYGIRRCDLCAAQILGRGGADICVICQIAMEEDAASGLEEIRAADHTEEAEEAEEFSLTAVVGRSQVAAKDVTAANDERGPQQEQHQGRRRMFDRHSNTPQGMVHRFAAGLRSITRRRAQDRR